MDYFATREDLERAVAERMKSVLDELNETKAHLASVKSNRDTILAEKRALEGRVVGKTPDGIIRTADALHVPRDLARQPQEYQRWRKMAIDEKLSLKIIDHVPEKDAENFPTVYTNDRKHYVHESVVRGDARKYQAERAFAEKHGVTMHLFTNANELPTEAFLKGDGK